MCTSQLYRVENRNKGTVTIMSGAGIETLQQVPYYRIQPIPCGHCIECRIQKAQEWAFRCMKEAQEYTKNIMLTLTYNDENLPTKYIIDKETGEVEIKGNLVKKDVQDFLKRLRKKYTGQTIRYYMCGEYGSDKEYQDWKGNLRTGTARPHYHIILFNFEPEDMKFHKWSKCEWSKQKNALYKSDIINKLWGKGWADLNEVNYETCCYVARYVTKKYYGKGAEEHYNGLQPEYTCMSRRPGIGQSFFEKNKEKFKNEETFWQVTKKGIKELKNIRYFDKLIEKDDEELFKNIKSERQIKSEKRWKEILQNTDISKEQYIKNLVSKREEKYKTLKKRTLI